MIRVSSARVDQLEPALSLLLSGNRRENVATPVKDVIEACQRGEISLDGLLLAEEDSVPVGAGLFVMQPDKAAFVWPPVAVERRDSEQIVDAIFEELRRQVDEYGAWLSQCMLDIDDKPQRAALLRNGFKHLTDLCHMERNVHEPLAPMSIPALTADSFALDEASDRFASLIERTYVNTLDCVGLQGTRSGLEALAGHQATGEFDPSRWKIYSHDGRDVGLLLMSDHPEQNAWEVVYMGVVPEARGNGYGAAILVDGIRQVRESGRGTIVLAVDLHNTYARRVYSSLGFREIALRAAHVRISPHCVE